MSNIYQGLRTAIRLSLIVVSLCCGCGAPQGSSTDWLSADQSNGTNNVAVFFAGSGPSIPSSPAFEQDLAHMQQVLQAPPYSFKIMPTAQASASQIISTTQSAASTVPRNGTLLFFYSGHGGDGTLGYDAANSVNSPDLQRAFASGSYQRLIVILEACHSGSFAEGATMIQPNAAAFQELIVMTAAKPTEESADDGTGNGSYFPQYLSQELTALAANPNATVSDLIRTTAVAANKANPSQSGDLEVVPQTILNETLVGKNYVNTTGSTGALVPPSTAPVTTVQTNVLTQLPPTVITGNTSMLSVLASLLAKLLSS